MKPVTLGAAAVATTASPDMYTIDINGVQLFAGGLVDGLIMKDNLPELQKCLGDVKTVAPDVQKIVNELAKGDLSDVIAGIKDAVALIQALPTDFKQCENVQDDLTKLKTWGNEFITPEGEIKIAENVMANWANIQTDIGTINSDMQSEQYVEAGETAADVVIIALGKLETPAPEVAYLYWADWPGYPHFIWTYKYLSIW